MHRRSVFLQVALHPEGTRRRGERCFDLLLHADSILNTIFCCTSYGGGRYLHCRLNQMEFIRCLLHAELLEVPAKFRVAKS